MHDKNSHTPNSPERQSQPDALEVVSSRRYIVNAAVELVDAAMPHHGVEPLYTPTAAPEQSAPQTETQTVVEHKQPTAVSHTEEQLVVPAEKRDELTTAGYEQRQVSEVEARTPEQALADALSHAVPGQPLQGGDSHV